MLSACQTLPDSPRSSTEQKIEPAWHAAPDVFLARERAFAGLKGWSLAAKIGIRSSTVNESANLVWRHRSGQHSLRLFGPLGAGSIRVEFDDDGVVLTDNRGQVHQGDSAQTLLSEITGWPIPIDALQYWFFVRPQPEFAYRYQFDDDDEVSLLQQLGWRIDYTEYWRFDVDRPPLPKKIVASKAQWVEGIEHTATVRLIIKSWKFEP